METNGKKRPVGRPRALTPDRKKEVLAFIRGGGSRTKAAEYVGVHCSTIENEAKADPEFLDSLTRAEAECYRIQVGKWTGADDWRAARDFCKAKWPSEFSEVRRNAMTNAKGEDLTPQQRQKLIDAIIAERKGLAARNGDE